MRILILEASAKERRQWEAIASHYQGILVQLPGGDESPETGAELAPTWATSLQANTYDEWTLDLDPYRMTK